MLPELGAVSLGEELSKSIREFPNRANHFFLLVYRLIDTLISAAVHFPFEIVDCLLERVIPRLLEGRAAFTRPVCLRAALASLLCGGANVG